MNINLQEQYDRLNGKEPEKIDEELNVFSYRITLLGNLGEEKQIENYLKNLKNNFKTIKQLNVNKIK